MEEDLYKESITRAVRLYAGRFNQG